MNLSQKIATGMLWASASLAQAGVITIDDFSTAQGPIVDLSANGIPVTSVSAARSMAINALSFTAPPSNSLQVAGGVLDITNGTGDDSEVTLGWNIAAGQIPLGATGPSFLFQVVASDANPINVDFFLGGASFGSFAIPANIAGLNISFGLAAGALAAFNAGGALELRMNGDPDWDLTLDSISFQFVDPVTPAPIPLPGSLALLGLGLVAMGLRRKSCLLPACDSNRARR